MFRSKRRDIVFPQSEHARLAGTLAAAWGNRDFAVPPLPFESFVVGVLAHDRGYGELDSESLPDRDEESWLPFQERGVDLHHRDDATEIVVLLHLRRLASRTRSPRRDQLCRRIDAKLEALFARQSIEREVFLRADTITNFCDNVAFEFCFEMPAQGSVQVDKRPDLAATASGDADRFVELHYDIIGDGTIRLDPWPLNCERISGFLIGYLATSYPRHPEQVLAPFEVTPRTDRG